MSKVKLISDDLHSQVLGYKPEGIPNKTLKAMSSRWEDFGLGDAIDRNEVVNLPLPQGLGDFRKVADDAVKAYGEKPIGRLTDFADRAIPDLPKTKPAIIPGWQKYTDSQWIPQINPPTSQTAMVLDFETVEVNGSWFPTCCAVLTDEAWYIWIANLQNLTPLIRFGKDQVVIAHNAGYDRSFLKTEYSKNHSGNYFFDTMSAWIACRGFTNQQRVIFAKATKEEILAPLWTNETAKNGLDDVYEFYTGEKLDKGVRDGIIEGGLPFVTDHHADVVWYCIKDVLATFKIFSHVYPELRQAQPSDISLTGQLLLGNTWLPISDRWNSYHDKAETQYQKVKQEVHQRLEDLALQTLHNPTTEQLESEALDWEEAKTGKNKGVPKWYRLCKGKPTSDSRIAPIILGCTWRGETIKWKQENPKEGYWYTDTHGALPHPEKRGKKLTDLFMQKMVRFVEEGVLDAPNGLKDLLLALISAVNWKSLRKRVAAVKVENLEGFNVTIPRLVVTGTVTRRCADNVWQVASNPKEKRIGTELKSMIEVPEGYSLVGADVDSQELWLAASLGDLKDGVCGSTPLGLMVLVGTKEDGTDPHSVVAAQLGISRDLAKNLIYGLCYGLGIKGAIDYIAKALPHKSMPEVTKIAEDLIKVFKGWKSGYSGSWTGGLASEAFNQMEAIANSKCPRSPALKARLSAALVGTKDFATTRQNWVVQTSGVDFRDIYVVYLRYFFDLLGVDGRLLMTIHDEARHIVKEGQEMLAAYAIQLAHLYTRAYFIDALGLNGIPAGIAWHSAVDVDKVWRKDPSMPCITPSQTEAIPAGYLIKPKDVLQWLEANPKVINSHLVAA